MSIDRYRYMETFAGTKGLAFDEDLSAILDGHGAVRRLVVPCSCGEAICQGWICAHLDEVGAAMDDVATELDRLKAENANLKTMVNLGSYQSDSIATLKEQNAALLELVREASEWYDTDNYDADWRHCCESGPAYPHESGCKFSAALEASK